MATEDKALEAWADAVKLAKAVINRRLDTLGFTGPDALDEAGYSLAEFVCRFEYHRSAEPERLAPKT
jgi:hypothetical protein